MLTLWPLLCDAVPSVSPPFSFGRSPEEHRCPATFLAEIEEPDPGQKSGYDRTMALLLSGIVNS